MKAIKVVVALALIVLLASFGIANMGGDTWVTASSPLPPGWSRGTPMLPRPPTSSMALPVIMLFALVAITIFDAIVNSPMTPMDEEEDLEGNAGTSQGDERTPLAADRR